MSQENVLVVRGMYEAMPKADIPTISGALHPQVEWWEAENFIYADDNPNIGPQAVLTGVFLRINAEVSTIHRYRAVQGRNRELKNQLMETSYGNRE